MPSRVFTPPRRVTFAVRANIRSAPSVSAPIVRRGAVGASFTAVSAVTGDVVSDNPWWYTNGAGEHLWAGATDQTDPASGDAEDVLPEPAPPIGSDPIAIDRSSRLTARDFNPVTTTKNLIVLHFTAGRTAKSALDTWRADPKRIATAYVVDVDGTIYEAFDPAFWASHLGVQGGIAQERRSIGIEIANVGPLKRSANGKTLNWWPKNFTTPFCTADEEHRYVAARYRGIEFFASFPEAQVQSVAQLVHHVADRFGIPKRLAPAARRGECDLAHFGSFSGIATHANFRRDKWDIGPAYDWDSLGV